MEDQVAINHVESFRFQFKILVPIPDAEGYFLAIFKSFDLVGKLIIPVGINADRVASIGNLDYTCADSCRCECSDPVADFKLLIVYKTCLDIDCVEDVGLSGTPIIAARMNVNECIGLRINILLNYMVTV